MTFQERHLLTEGDKMKYAMGAGLGALGMAAHHIMGGSEDGPGILDELRDANQEGHLGNTMIDKSQNFLDQFRSQGSGENNSADSSGSSGSSGSNLHPGENDMYEGGNSRGHHTNDYSNSANSGSSGSSSSDSNATRPASYNYNRA